MKVVYVAGPYRAKTPWEIEQNVRKAEKIALRIWKTGNVAICPHAMTRFYQGSAPDLVFCEGTLELLRRCDAAFFLPGWKISRGSQDEFNEAFKLRIPTFRVFPLLVEWLDHVK